MLRSMPTPTAVDLDRLTQVVGWELEAPVVCLSLVDGERRLQTSAIGMPPPVALIVSWSFARHVSPSGALMVPDARKDSRVAGCPSVRDGAVAAYLGLRLTNQDGRTVGTMSVMDTKARTWTPAHLAFVQRLCDHLTRGDED